MRSALPLLETKKIFTKKTTVLVGKRSINRLQLQTSVRNSCMEVVLFCWLLSQSQWLQLIQSSWGFSNRHSHLRTLRCHNDKVTTHFLLKGSRSKISFVNMFHCLAVHRYLHVKMSGKSYYGYFKPRSDAFTCHHQTLKSLEFNPQL